jgi:hypothetical protein
MTLVLLGAVGDDGQLLWNVVADGPPTEDGQPIHVVPFVPGQLPPTGAGTCYDNLDAIHW